MASALQNPNDRSRINLITRAIMKGKISSPAAGVSQWKTAGSNSRFRTSVGLPRGGKRALAAAMAAGGQSKSERKEYAKVRRAVAKEFGKHEGYGPSRGKRGRKVSYATRALGTHASRYLDKDKKTKSRKSSKGKTLRGLRVDVDGVQTWNTNRVDRRGASKWGKMYGRPDWRAANPFGTRYPEAVLSAQEMMEINKDNRFSNFTPKSAKWEMGKAKKTAGKRKAAPARAGKRRSSKKAVANGLFARRNGLALKNGLALSNPLGGLALSNPEMGAKAYFLGYALPVTIAGAAAGGIHAVASTSGITTKLSDLVEKIPVAGPWVADNAPYTLQGLVVGSGLAVLAPMVGGSIGKYLALAGGAALVVGGGIDTFNRFIGGSEAADDADFSEDLDFDLESELSEDLSGLALGDLAFTNMGDGFAYETAPLSAAPSSEEYGQASLADAQYSGADFSVEEGEALLNGRRSFAQRFGNPPMRMSGRPTAGPSHLAGRDGHRWGWLVKMIGWEKASAIAALPAKRRVQFLKKLRQASIASYHQLMQEAQALQAEAQSANAEFRPAAGLAASGAVGASGGTNYLGEPALFMGA